MTPGTRRLEVWSRSFALSAAEADGSNARAPGVAPLADMLNSAADAAGANVRAAAWSEAGLHWPGVGGPCAACGSHATNLNRQQSAAMHSGCAALCAARSAHAAAPPPGSAWWSSRRRARCRPGPRRCCSTVRERVRGAHSAWSLAASHRRFHFKAEQYQAL